MLVFLLNRAHYYLFHSPLGYVGKNKHILDLDCSFILTQQRRVYLTYVGATELPPYGEEVNAWVSDILKRKILEKQYV